MPPPASTPLPTGHANSRGGGTTSSTTTADAADAQSKKPKAPRRLLSVYTPHYPSNIIVPDKMTAEAEAPLLKAQNRAIVRLAQVPQSKAMLFLIEQARLVAVVCSPTLRFHALTDPMICLPPP